MAGTHKTIGLKEAGACNMLPKSVQTRKVKRRADTSSQCRWQSAAPQLLQWLRALGDLPECGEERGRPRLLNTSLEKVGRLEEHGG